ncbi:MAG: hypothetical protein DRI86_12755, partial [Bacteroidetes bacterium]
MKRIFILFFISVLCSQLSYSQSYNYTTSTGDLGTTYSWIDCSSGTEIQDADWLQNVGLGDKKDDGYAEISWPFNFQFYDSYYFAGENMYFCTNGFIRFDDVSDDNATNTYNNDISSYSPNLGEIVAFALEDAGLEDNNSTVHYLTTGSGSSRIFTIEIQNLEVRFNQGKYIDVQISFYETSNIIVIKVGGFDVSSSYDTYLGIHSGNSTYKDQWGELQSIGQDKWRAYTPPAKAYGGITITQASSDDVYPSDDNEMVRIQFDITGGGGAFDLTKIVVRSVNDDNGDVSNAKLFHTSSSTFSTDHQIGTTQSVVNANNDYKFNGFSYNMPGGTSYIWVTYSVASSAINGNDIGAKIRKNKITLNNIKYLASTTSDFLRTIGYFEWDGSTSTDWNTASNWSNNSVPTSSDNVIIISAPANQPHILNGNTDVCNDLTIKSGATLTVDDNGSLDISGSIINNGSLACGDYEIDLLGSNNELKGSGVWTTSSFELGNSSKYTLQNNISCAFVEINNNASLVVDEHSLACTGIINSMTGSILSTTTGSIEAEGEVTIDGTYTHGTGTFYYSGNNSQSILNKTYHKLKIKASSGTRTLLNIGTCKTMEVTGSGIVELSSNIDVDDNIIIGAGTTIDMNGHSITLSGDWTNNGTLTSGSETVMFDGIGSSHMYGSTNFYNLTVNKSTGDVYSDGTNHITHTLALTNGILNSSSNTSVILDAGATISGGGTSSYVDGPLRKDGNTAFIFPVGDFRKYAPCEIGAPSSSVQFVAEYTMSGHSNNTSFNSPLTKVSL